MNIESTIKKNHSIKDLIASIEQIAINGSKLRSINDFAKSIKNLPTKEKNKAILDFAYNVAYMELSPDDRQQLRTINNILREQKANCTGYTSLISAICYALKEPHTYRLTDISGGGFEHIYILKDGYVLDATAGQPNENAKNNRENICKFNFEFPYLQKRDFNMLTVVNGTRTKRKNVNGLLSDLFTMGTTLWSTSDQCKRDCDLKYPFDAEQRQFCKNSCEMSQTQTQTQLQTQPQTMNYTNILLVGGLVLGGVFLLTKKK